MAQSYRDLFDQYIANIIKSRQESARKNVASQILLLFEQAKRELPAHDNLAFYESCKKTIYTLVQNGTDQHERIGGLEALNAIIGVDEGSALSGVSHVLKRVFTGNDRTAIVLAAKVLGHLVQPGGTNEGEIVDSEVKTSLEWLSSGGNENKRFAAVLILYELARSSATHTNRHIQDILEVIWTALRDPKVLVREQADKTVSECLYILIERDPGTRTARLQGLYDEVNRGFQIGSVEAIHGSLLVLKDLVTRGTMFMHGQRYKDSCERALSFKDHRDFHIRKAVIEIIPVMAGYAPNEFYDIYLHRAITHLQNQMKAQKPEERSIAFVAVGSVALAMRSRIAPYLDHILLLIREALGKTKGSDDVFGCIGMISRAVGQTLSKYMEALMDPIFACRLSKSLTQALVDLTHNIPPIKEAIQDRLLDMLCRVLCGRPFQDPGHPQSSKTPAIYDKAERDRRENDDHKEADICLALDTLGAFDFSGKSLNELVRDVAIRYVEDDSPFIRKAAALTSCQLFLHDPIVRQTSVRSIQVVGDVVQKLLTVAVADPDSSIRLTVLKALDARFDVHLAKAENVRTLFLTVNDEEFRIREAAISIIGRLSAVNPAYVFPSLRKVLIQLLTELEQSNVAKNKADSAQLISRLVRSSSHLIKPYVDPMIKVLLPKTTDLNPHVASTTLSAIGDLAVVGQDEMLQYVPQLMPIIIENLEQQHTEERRFAALSTLENLATNSGYVIQPYIEYPNLLNVLINLVKHDDNEHLRENTIRLMGIIGALDPYKHQEKQTDASQESANKRDVKLLIENSKSSGDGSRNDRDSYASVVVIDTLMRIIKDPNHDSIHKHVVDAVMGIYKTMGLSCLRFLKQVVEGILSIMDAATSDTRKHYFSSLGLLISIVRSHIRPHLHDILLAVQIHWHESTTTMISLIEQISRVLEGEFKIYLASVLPLMLDLLEHDGRARERVLQALVKFKSNAEEYMHLIIPAIVRIFRDSPQSSPSAKYAIEAVGKISRQVNISEFASQIIHPLAKILAGPDPALKQVSLDTLCALIYQMGSDFLNFVSTIDKALKAHKFPHHNYSLIVGKLQKGEPLPQDLSPEERYNHDEEDQDLGEASSKKLVVNQLHLKNAWESTHTSTKEDWVDWMRRFSVELLRESPQQALRACSPLTSVYRPIAAELFNVAFASCWTELYTEYQQELADALQTALKSPNILPEISLQLLRLAEFMEHDDKPLPIDIRVLSQYAAVSHAYAKALYYKETEFINEQSQASVEHLIRINNTLQQSDAAFGMLRKAQMQYSVSMGENWFEQLARWEDALEAYQRAEKTATPDKIDGIMHGKMRCLHALGNWDVLSSLAQEKWMTANSTHRKKMAPLAAAAAWTMGQWELMDTYLSVLQPGSGDHSYYSAVLRIHRNQFTDAAQFIAQTRRSLEGQFRQWLGESYARALEKVEKIQALAELEEVIAYKKAGRDPAKRERMLRTWSQRLKGCRRSVDTWQRMLTIRALVVTPCECEELYIKFASICRKNNRNGLAEKTLNQLIDSHGSLLGSEAQPKIAAAPYPVQYAINKHIYSNNSRQQGLRKLQALTLELRDAFEQHSSSVVHDSQTSNAPANMIEGLRSRASANSAPDKEKVLGEWATLLCRFYLKQGEWIAQGLDGDWQSAEVEDVLRTYKEATRYQTRSYKAWHEWALANFEIVTSMTAHTDRASAFMTLETINAYVVPAIHGFFKSIELSSNSAIQDTLRLLTLWFAHGSFQEVTSAVTAGIRTVNLNTWMDVVPQLIARINQASPRVRASVHNLLCEMGTYSPQRLIYPLTVLIHPTAGGPVTADSNEREAAARSVLNTIRDKNNVLCDQAFMVSEELIRIAQLWNEEWHDVVQSVFVTMTMFGRPDWRILVQRLLQMHNRMARGPQTMNEMAFIQAHGSLLHQGKELLEDLLKSGDVEGNPETRRADDLYMLLYRRWEAKLKVDSNLDMQHVSPRLWQATDMMLAVPGTHIGKDGKATVLIQSFSSYVFVMNSKKRPRRIEISGDDGKKYGFCLKGNEDIRQDERCMQLFGLVNTLLAKDPQSLERRLDITRFSAIPLGGESGLLSWVEESDTIHALIREYRESRKILLNIEKRIMVQMFANTVDYYDFLPLLQKVEVFSYALDNTTGQDLYKILWLKATSSETWLERRTRYTRSLAVMSIVGYFLGLGDRHPANLMISQKTGQVVHIDFGDCFEVAMRREKYPELVQFRLTRMMTFAMEVSQIEGSFRTTCEIVFRICREHKESLFAVLEAFIHDPLMTWRLTDTEDNYPSGHMLNSRLPHELNDPLNMPLGPGSLPMGRSRAGTSNMTYDAAAQDAQSKLARRRTMAALERVKQKLNGQKLNGSKFRSNEDHVEHLLQEATSVENLCQLYVGWCAFW